jgi:hypothetical protein
MRSSVLVTAALFLIGAAPSTPLLAQTGPPDSFTGARPGHDVGVGDSLPRSGSASNIVPGDTRSSIAPTLPGPAIGENAGPQEYLKAARASLVAGRTGQAQQALEMAETRALDRSVAQGQTDVPSHSELISRIGDARRALGSGDRAHAIQLIDSALSG